jgi:hypothetical protein
MLLALQYKFEESVPTYWIGFGERRYHGIINIFELASSVRHRRQVNCPYTKLKGAGM